MKKVIFFFLIALFTASCSKNTVKTVAPQNHTFTYAATCDTTIVVKVPVQSAIHMCSGGLSKYNKITAWKDSAIYLHKGQTIVLSNEYMNGQGWYWFSSDPTVTNSNDNVTTTTAEESDYGFPSWMKWMFWNLLIPALILFLAYLLGRWLWNNRSTATPVAPANPGADGVEQNRQQYVPTFVDLTVINRMPEVAQVPLVQVNTTGMNSPISNLNIQIGEKLIVGYKPSDATTAKKAEAGAGNAS